MEAKEYLTKVTEICETYIKNEGCMDGTCPLIEYYCGSPKEPEEIEKVLEIVETAELKSH